ncbi:MAG: serine hydrolase [Pseudomonadota bacterium]|jgi:CubicO group peptidase (beta-lactamase class C family)
MTSTRSFRRAALFMASAMFVAAPVMAAAPEGFNARVEALRRQAGVPGMSVAIVEQGKVTLAEGFGVRKLGGSDKVDADTIFPTGSTGKAFTVAALAVLVDQGKIKWDDKVTDHLPGFQMYDPWVTREMTIRDLLVHRSGLGLGAGDLLFVPRSNLSRAESVKRLRYIKPATSFRSGYAYDNVLYMVAGQLIEAVSGQTWEAFTHEHVLKAAGMKESTSDGEARFATANRAFPHARMNGGLRGAGDQEPLDEHDELGRNAAPAGGMAISASDMARWLQIQLAHGKLPEGDGRLFSEASSREMWNPVVVMPIRQLPEPLKAAQSQFDTYALGWNVRDYQGTKLVMHGGAVFGFLTMVVLIPEKQVGFSIVINSEDRELVNGLTYELVDHYLGRPNAHWPEKWSAFNKQQVSDAQKALKAVQATPAKIGPSLPLERYAGSYADAWYGNIAVGGGKDKLTIDFTSTPRMTGTLEHWQYDTFVTRFDDKAIEPAYVTFGLDADGKVDRVTMRPVSPIADFSYDYQDLLFTPARKEK